MTDESNVYTGNSYIFYCGFSKINHMTFGISNQVSKLSQMGLITIFIYIKIAIRPIVGSSFLYSQKKSYFLPPCHDIFSFVCRVESAFHSETP